MNRALHGDLYKAVEFAKIAGGSKMGSAKPRYSRKIVVPEPLVLSKKKLPNLSFDIAGGVPKSEVSKNQPMLCVPLFLSSRCSRKQHFCRADVVRTTVFVRPELCVPLFL